MTRLQFGSVSRHYWTVSTGGARRLEDSDDLLSSKLEDSSLGVVAVLLRDGAGVAAGKESEVVDIVVLVPPRFGLMLLV